MNMNDTSTQLLYTTVPIYAKEANDKIVSGTGFIFSIKKNETRSIPLLITNYHVLKDAVEGFFEIHLGKNEMPDANKSIRLQFDKSIVNNNKLGNLDLIAIPLAASINDITNKGMNLFYKSVDQTMIPSEEQFNNFAALEDITFIGYPSGLYDEKNKLPIIRQGITATPLWNNYRGENKFLIDAGVFPGSSGSPVFVYNRGAYPTKNGIAVGNRLLFVGIISETMQTIEPNENYLNLGSVINSSAMFHELKIFLKNTYNENEDV